MRDCTACGASKPPDAFGVNRRYKDGKHRACLECERERRRAFYARNRDLEAERGRRYREQHPERRAATVRKSRYGIEPADYDRLWIAQGGQCVVCLETTKLHVDHCHETGEIRGLLCGDCNRSLGILDEDPMRITALAEYAAQRCRGGDVRNDRHHIRQPVPSSP